MNYLTRFVFNQLKKHLEQPEMSLILGPRQAGKTTLLHRLEEELAQKKVPTTYLNLDVIEDFQYFRTQHTLLKEIQQRIGEKGVVFLDEIHRLTNSGLFLKGLYDLKTPYKFIATGSGALELKANIIEPMTGRKKIFYCLPLSFTEFVANQMAIASEDVSARLDANPYAKNRFLSQYLTYGGYPRVILAQTHHEKIDILSELYTSYLEKDIQLILKVEKEQSFSMLVKILASQVGSIINRAELASTLGVTEKTIEKYLLLLEKTFVVSLVRPFFRNSRKELRKSPKVYFYDLGLLHFSQGIRPHINYPVSGPVFENACYLRLLELRLVEPIRFWRSVSGAEVDFILTSSTDGTPLPIEVKLSPRKNTLGKSLFNFLKKYAPHTAYFYTKEATYKTEKFGIPIISVPYHRLLPVA